MSRLSGAWHALAPEQRLGALTALGLFASMFLPWYSKTDTVVVHGAAKATETSLSAFQAFSFVEAAVLLVSAGVLAMLFARAEERPFQLPGGDGLIVMIAGGWSALLIFYRLLDKPGLHGNERVTATVGVEWGIFIALLLALGLVYAGARVRALERPQPPLRHTRGPREHEQPARTPATNARRPRSGAPRFGTDMVDASEDETAVVGPAAVRAPDAAARFTRERGGRARYPPSPPSSSANGEQLSFEDQPTRRD